MFAVVLARLLVFVVFGPPRGTNPYHTLCFTLFSVPQGAQIHTTPRGFRYPKRHKPIPHLVFYVVFDSLYIPLYVAMRLKTCSPVRARELVRKVHYP